jgi:hypothetical protein
VQITTALFVSVGTVLQSQGESLDILKFPYSTLVGKPLYISVCTRPDISYAVGALSRYMSKPSVEHWKVLKGV